MKVPQNPPNPNTPSGDVATQQWVQTYYAQKSSAVTSYRKTTAKLVVNTVTETDLLNGEIIIRSGVMGPTGRMRLTMSGVFAQASGSTQAAPRFRFGFGGTNFFDTGAPAAVMGSTAQSWPWKCVVEVQNTAVASQVASLLFTGSGATVNFAAFLTNGLGSYVGSAATNFTDARGENSGGTVNTSQPVAVTFSVINPVASASVSTQLNDALAEII